MPHWKLQQTLRAPGAGVADSYAHDEIDSKGGNYGTGPIARLFETRRLMIIEYRKIGRYTVS